MTAPPGNPAEPASAREAPPVIHLPHLPPPVMPGVRARPKRQRGNVEQFRTDDTEHGVLVEKAQAAGLSLGAYYRSVLLGDAGARARRAPPTEASRARALDITAINRVGNLINQGIRALHDTARRAAEGDERDRLAEEIAATRALLEDTLPALRETLATVLGDDRQG